MPKIKKRKNTLRLCSVCQKPGHNKARCPHYSTPTEPRNINRGIKFFIPENQISYGQSPHLINLQHKNLWDKIQTHSPDKNFSPYQDYHADRSIPAVEPSDINPPVVNFTPLPPRRRWSFFHRRPKISLLPRRVQIIPTEKEKISRQEKIAFTWPVIAFSWKKSLLGATLAALIIVLPLKAGGYYQDIKNTTGAVAADGTRGFLALQESTLQILQADITGAQDSTQEALNNFNSALTRINNQHRLLQKIAGVIPVVKGEIASRQKIITAGQKITLGNQHLLTGIRESSQNNNDPLTKKIRILTGYLTAAVPNYEAALADMRDIDTTVLPLEYQAPFMEFRELFTIAVTDLRTLAQLGGMINKIFGGEGLERYLLIFQNPHEIRPTGGFMGSFAVLDIKNGQVVNLDIPAGGSYDLKGQLDEWVEPPTPLLLTNNRWEFQDANWFPDFSASAEKIMWFYRHSRQRTADGVIAINASVLERLLTIMGPVTEENRQLTLTADNAITTIQEIVENSPDKKNKQPKQILSDLAPRFVEFLQNIKPEQAMPALFNLSEALTGKEIQLYFTDPETEADIEELNWGGKIKPTKDGQDYLLVINTNIQGQKSDAKIQQTVEHQALISPNGEVTVTVAITRRHGGEAGEIFYGQTNIDYLRIYVPRGSQLISAQGYAWPHEQNFRAPNSWTGTDEFLQATEKEIGFDPETGTRITEEFGKTAFGNWLITEPGESSRIVFTYRLPYRVFTENAITDNTWQKIFDDNYLTSQYQLIVQKQSGIEMKFLSQIIYPDDWHPNWQTGPDATLATNGLSIDTQLVHDLNWGLVMKKIIK